MDLLPGSDVMQPPQKGEGQRSPRRGRLLEPIIAGVPVIPGYGSGNILAGPGHTEQANAFCRPERPSFVEQWSTVLGCGHAKPDAVHTRVKSAGCDRASHCGRRVIRCAALAASWLRGGRNEANLVWIFNDATL